MSSQAQAKQPPQEQERQPGRESQMTPKPEFLPRFPGAGKLKEKVALITGGDSGIGRSVAVHMAREGADIGVVYLEESDDARETQRHVEAEGRKCLVISGDVAKEVAGSPKRGSTLVEISSVKGETLPEIRKLLGRSRLRVIRFGPAA